MTKKKTPERLEGNKGCTNCALHQKSEHVCIMGKGPIPARIMVVLDNPTLEDGDLNAPLSGKNLIYLMELFEKTNIPWNECYITTTVKCGVPKGQKLKASEIKACSEYLDHELDVVKPRYILTMGATSLKAMVGAGKITEIHGTALKHKKGATLLPVYAPGVVWRDPSKLPDMMDDLNRFSKIINGATVGLPKMNFEVVDSFDRFNRMVTEMKEETAISWDIETTGLDRFNDDITVMGFGLRSKQWILPISLSSFTTDAIQNMMEILTSLFKKKKFITANGKFDNLFTRTKYGVRFNNAFDTMVAGYAMDENTPNGLKYTAKRVFGIPDWDLGLDTKKGQGSKEKLYEYLAYDLYYTRKLYIHFKKELAKDEATERIFYHLLMPAFHAYENVQMEGVYINQEKFAEIDEILMGRLHEIDLELQKVRIKSGYEEPVNWGSTQQLAKYLFNYLKLPILGKTATGNPSTAGDLLTKLKHDHACIPLIIERKGIKQLHSFFINGWKEKMHNGKIYPSFNIHTTVTGRTSSNGPNLQQVPRDKRIRTLIGAPEGWTMVEIDYSQVELRVVCHHSKDPKMVLVYSTGKDIHTNTAVSISGKHEKDITKEDRKKAKPVNFGFVYGMGHFKFVEYADSNYGVILTQKEAKEYRRRFFEEYNYLPEWHNKQRKIVRAYKQVRNLIGRLRRLPDIDSPDKGVKSEAERQSINSPIQSFASDLMLMSVIEVDQTLPKEDTRIVGTVHDAGLYIIRNDMLNVRIPQIKAIMESPKLLTDVFKAKLDVPIIADVEIGNWGNGIGWDGEHINILEDGSIELSKKESDQTKWYFRHPESDSVFLETDPEKANRAFTEGCDEIDRKEYRKFKRAELQSRKRKG